MQSQSKCFNQEFGVSQQTIYVKECYEPESEKKIKRDSLTSEALQLFSFVSILAIEA